MKKVITYGTYDHLHFGHIRLLERARELGDYLIVGVTSDDFDAARGKINVQQSLSERMAAVQATGLADEIIVEEYEGQKIDDIQRYGVDIFTVGSDWQGKFDYLNQYCDVVYLKRTEGISSSQVRSETSKLKLGLVGDVSFLNKYLAESAYVNGLEVAGICCKFPEALSPELSALPLVTTDFAELLKNVDAIYLASASQRHTKQINQALDAGVHVLSEACISHEEETTKQLIAKAKEKHLCLMHAIKPAFCTAYRRMCLLIESGAIGDIVSISATCTNMREPIIIDKADPTGNWGSFAEWGPAAMLPVFDLLGTDWRDLTLVTKRVNEDSKLDAFTQANFIYPHAVATVKVAKGAKAEGSLVVAGTKGYAYVPAPWWKTDYFEFRFEDQGNNKRYFYQLDGEGIRNQLVSFLRGCTDATCLEAVHPEISIATAKVLEKLENDEGVIQI